VSLGVVKNMLHHVVSSRQHGFLVLKFFVLNSITYCYLWYCSSFLSGQMCML